MSDETPTTLPPDSSPRQSTEPLWDIEDVAAYLKVAARTIYRWLSEGKIPHSRVGAQYRFDPDAIRRWALSGSPQPAATETVEPDADAAA